MALKFKHQSKDEIPEAQRALYVERDVAWVLDVEGVADKAKLDEFRTNNIALTNELKEFKQRFEGIDPDEVRKLAAEKRRLEEEQQIKAGEVEKVFEKRLTTARSDWEKQLGAVTKERDALNTRLAVIQIDQAVVAEATKRGLRPTALEDATARGVRTYVPERRQKTRRWTDKPAERKAAFRANRRRVRTAKGRRLNRWRSERCERTFAHVCETGGGRRSWLRGLKNVSKYHTLKCAAYNLGLLLRTVWGYCKPRNAQGGRMVFLRPSAPCWQS